ISSGLVASCHGIYRGGLGVHAAMTAIGGRFGLTIELGKAPVLADESIRDDQVLFSESCGRFLVTVPKGCAREFEGIFDGLPYGLVGEVTENPELVIFGKSGQEILRENIFLLRKSWMGNQD
ncbi:MAG TPA: phosphoribosylformylglycinamidine synthase, partial [Deltaproteobacteria bacterium]|nr:phosphoribosylformylglycinamidine synthase [Deltaproteobacteria bacterium]